jgi:hypothetical protein
MEKSNTYNLKVNKGAKIFMACFLVSLGEAIIVGAAKHIVSYGEKKASVKPREQVQKVRFGSDIKWSKKLSYLEMMALGGSFLLAGEHVLHGEVVPYPPFLTAMTNPDDTVSMLNEIGTVGVTMAVCLTLVWGVGVLVADYLKYRSHKKISDKAEAK